MTSKLLAQGAEASVYQSKSGIIKERLVKTYRYPVLDTRLRKARTKKEVKLLEKASKIINVPKIISNTDFSITLEEIKGKKLAISLDKLSNKLAIAKQIGFNVAKLHDAGIIHGDLTTSNMIWHSDKLYLIDFGLGFESTNIEDKSVDLHVLKEALTARHNKHSENIFGAVVQGYKSSANANQVIKRLEAVEKRGRYKQAY
jgi:Kae1-associated kinase Bud32